MNQQEKIHHMRQMLDSIKQAVSMLKPIEVQMMVGMEPRIMNSTEIVICIQRIDFARAWMGKLLGFMNENTPYTERPRNAQDTGAAPFGWLPEEPHTTRVNEMRKKLLTQINTFQVLYEQRRGYSWAEENAWINAHTYLTEAQIALGWELGRIYESGK